jgi:hypothetical protein
MDSLTFNYEPDSVDTVGQLFVRVRTSSFSGYGFVWAEPDYLEDFAAQLEAYPIRAEDAPALSWGLDECQGVDLILSVEIRPADGSGTLRVCVELADMYTPSERVRTSFLTTYSDVQSFRASLAPILAGEEARATLLGRR